MPEGLRYSAYGLGVLSSAILLSYSASLLYALLSGLDLSSIKPWTLWQFMPALKEPAVQSRFFLSLGAPLLVALMIAAQILNPEGNDKDGAQWARAPEIKKAGLLAKDGVLLGRYKGRYLISESPSHIFCAAPTRSGKGVGLVIPNLLNWPGSLICLDVKHENYKITAGFRKKCGQNVYMWTPYDLHSHSYNPLDAISADKHKKIGDLEVIAWVIIPEPAYGDKFWASEARSLFVGLALYVLENAEMPSTLGAIYRLLGTEADLGDICRHIVKTHHELPAAGRQTLMNFANKAAKERSGVKSSLHEAMNIWKSPTVDAATSNSDFLISDLRTKDISIYVGVRPGEMDSLSPLLRIFFEQVIKQLTIKEPGQDDKNKVLMILDEFHTLGKMRSMSTAFTLLAGYNCRVMAVVQNLSLLDTVYDKAERNNILANCAQQIFYAANDLDTTNYISQSCGEKTVKSISTTQRKSFKYEAPSKNISTRRAPLLSKEKVRQLPKHEEIIISEASAPLRAHKIVYYKDRRFKDRLIASPPLPKLHITDHDIPEFDMSSSQAHETEKSDPNQIKLFEETQENARASLTSTLAERSEDQDDVFVKELIKNLDDELL